ncbi:helix-turn-helix transcriptional regulator [Desulfobacterales bacterium HSG17]|nr:helix-turn-helix transcriptional regulator [Desulfobacterales bacterium HSG17]
MGIVESNLKELLNPFSKKLSDPMVNFTPAEIQIASFIKQGITTKEIAQALNCSPRTIDTHRDNIRKKLNIKKKNINLRSSLLNL